MYKRGTTFLPQGLFSGPQKIDFLILPLSHFIKDKRTVLTHIHIKFLVLFGRGFSVDETLEWIENAVYVLASGNRGRRKVTYS